MTRMKKTTLVSALTLLLLLGLFAVQSKGQDLLPSHRIDFQGSADLIQNVFRPDCNLVEKIEAAKKMLNESPALKLVEKSTRIKLRNGRYTTTYSLLREQTSLAILDSRTCDIREERYWLDESDIKKGNTIRRLHEDSPGDIPKFMPADPQNELSVRVNWWNNHNSDLSILDSGSGDDSRYIILANKFLLPNDNIAYPDEITGPRYSEIVYVPYSDLLHTDELKKIGHDFMSSSIDEVAKELDDLGIESRAYPGKLITETITPGLVKNIFLTEQIDPSAIFAAEDNGQRLAERVFIRYATNGQKSFRYTFSKTGAAGAGQIMPGTYATVPRAYPTAKLIKDVDIGRADFKNGIKATFLILDMKLSEIEAKAQSSARARSIWNAKTLAEKQEAVAAAYNGGSSKYKPLTGTISLAVRETVDFVRKFKMVRDLNLFN